MTHIVQPVPYERITILRESLGEGGVTTVTIFDKARMIMTQEEPEPPMLSIIDATKVSTVPPPPPPTVHIEIKPERNEDGIWVHAHGSAVFELPDGGEDDGTPFAP